MLRCAPYRIYALVTVLTLVFGTNAHAGKIAAGWGHAILALPNGTVWTWGDSTYGQTGEPYVSHPAPTAVPGMSNIVAVASGQSHCLALASDGTVWAWGLNSSGQIGDGTVVSAYEPVHLALSSIVAVAAGNYHSVALASDGTVYTWGYNVAGQLGNNTTANTSSPAPVSGIQAAAIAAGPNHTLVVSTNGTVWAWGENGSGQLGDGSTTRRLTPVQMTGIANATAVAAGTVTSHILLADGTLRATGWNGSGTIGDGTTTQRTTPVVVSTLTDILEIVTAHTHVVARRADGTVWTWGGNSNGELGLGDRTLRTLPTQIPGLSSIGSIGTGVYNTYAVTAEDAPLGAGGTVFAWGANSNGQLGDGTTVASTVPIAITAAGYTPRVATPRLSYGSGSYSGVLSVRVSDVTNGAAIHYTTDGSDPTIVDSQVANNGTVLVDRTLTLKARAFKSGTPDSHVASATYDLVLPSPTHTPWGGTFTSPQTISLSVSVSGSTIRYTTDGSSPTATSPVYTGPITVSTTTNIKAVAFRSGWTQSPSSTSTYTINYGTLAAPTFSAGTGTYEGSVNVGLSAEPGTTIRYTTNGSEPTSASAFYTQPLTVSATTTLKAKAFQLDHTPSSTTTATYTIQAAPPILTLATGEYAPGDSVSIIGTDGSATIRITLTGLDPTSADPVAASGASLFIGNFTLKARAFKAGCLDSSVVSATYSLSQQLSPGSISGGGSHSLIATPDGRVYGFGSNTSSQLGDGTTILRTTPTAVPNLTGVIAVSAGQYHSLALTPDGRVWSWGANGYGRLGDGTTTTRSRPVEVAGLIDVVAVSAGGSHSLALTADGHVYAWGLNSNGQLGLGSTVSQSVPMLVQGLIEVVAIAAGANHSLAVTSSGQLYAWGVNAFGQLGDGTTTQRISPTLIIGLTGVVSVAAGTNHSLARVQSGAVQAWGYGGAGQLGLGTTTNRTTPVLVPGLTAIDVAAAGSSSFARRTDGALVAWGANNVGQLGDTTTTQRNAPTLVDGPAVVALMEPGDTHTLAVTPDGHLWTWGAGGSGQRGDGTTTGVQATPQDVFTLAGIWGATPAPTLSLAPGTYNSPQTLIVSSALAGTVVRYTTSGMDPTETDPEIPVNGQFAINGTQSFRFRAWTTALPPSAVVSAAYVIQPLPPTISPNSGTYTSAQTMTLASPTSETVVRYTTDGTDPTETSPTYVSPFTIATSTTVRARALRTGWTPSTVATAVLTFNYGTLVTPTVSPGSGTYAPGQAITLTAPAGSIHYTLDGSEPTPSSPLYLGPIILGGGISTVKARAFQVDWADSAVASWTYQIIDDTLPPTITATLSPSGESPQWHDTAVDITFTCSDTESGVATCPSPVVVQREGANIEISRTAVDNAGNAASVTVRLSVDLAPPRVVVYTPEEGQVLPIGTSTLTVRGSAVDFGSGATSVSCNGIAATVTGQMFTCDVPVATGTNAITVAATDAVNHVAQKVVSFAVGDAPAPASLTVTPAKMTMIASQTRPISVIDQQGRLVGGGTWTSSNPSVAEVLDDNGSWVVHSLAAGEATLILTRDGLTAETLVTVLAMGSVMPDGTLLWELPSTQESAPNRARVLRAMPQGDGSEGQPAIFYVDEGSGWNGTQLTRVAPGRITATTLDGRQLWTRAIDVSEGLLKHVAADAYGGLVMVFHSTYTPQWTPQRIRRLDGRTGQITWEYYSYDGELSEVAIHPNGTVYVTDEQYHTADTFLVALDGVTGLTTQWPLPQGHVTRYTNGRKDIDVPDWPGASGPIVREDGTVALISGRSISESYQLCSYGTSGSSTCWPDDAHAGSSSVDTFLIELHEGATGPLMSTLAPMLSNASSWRLLPDGKGGMLVASRRSGSVMRLDSNRQWAADASLTATIYDASNASFTEAEYVLGNTSAYALVKSNIGSTSRADVIEFDPDTLAVTAANPVPGAPYVNLRFALKSGGAYVSGPTLGSSAANDDVVGPELLAGWGSALTLHRSASATPADFARSNVRGAASTNAFTWFYTTEQAAAFAALNWIYPTSDATTWEWGGLVCFTGAQYYWSGFVTSKESGTVDVLGQTSCDGSIAVAGYHTHEPLTGNAEPSGFIPGTTLPHDINTADQNPQLTFYLKAPTRDASRPGSTHFMRYRRGADGSSSRLNTFKFGNGTWVYYPCTYCQ